MIWFKSMVLMVLVLFLNRFWIDVSSLWCWCFQIHISNQYFESISNFDSFMVMMSSFRIDCFYWYWKHRTENYYFFEVWFKLTVLTVLMVSMFSNRFWIDFESIVFHFGRCKWFDSSQRFRWCWWCRCFQFWIDFELVVSTCVNDLIQVNGFDGVDGVDVSNRFWIDRFGWCKWFDSSLWFRWCRHFLLDCKLFWLV